MHDQVDARVRDEWEVVLAAVAPLLSLWCSDLNPRFRASRASRALGFASAHAFNESLRARGLPPYQVLRDSYIVVRLLEVAPAETLSRWSWKHGREPATYYRFVKRVTGLTWRALNSLGAERVRLRALEHWRPYERKGHNIP